MNISKVFLDNTSGLSKSAQNEVNSVLRSEYNRFQRKSYQKENTTEPLPVSKGTPNTLFVKKYSSRYYNGVNQLSLTIDTSDLDTSSSYAIVKDLGDCNVVAYGDESGNLVFYYKEGQLYVYTNDFYIQDTVRATVCLKDNL